MFSYVFVQDSSGSALVKYQKQSLSSVQGSALKQDYKKDLSGHSLSNWSTSEKGQDTYVL